MRNSKLRLPLGNLTITVDLDTFTYDKVIELREKVAEIRRKNSIYSKYPFDEGESREHWSERVSKEAQEDGVRKDGETVEDHLRRLFDAQDDTHKTTQEIVLGVCAAFNQPLPTDDQLRKANWLGLNSFLYDVLSLAKIPCPDFEPVELGK